jgi:hypothetical protein
MADGQTFRYLPSSAPMTETISSIISCGSNCPFMISAKLALMSCSRVKFTELSCHR